MAITTHCRPNFIAASLSKFLFLIAAELTAILSAPHESILRKSSKVRMPPPTVRGKNTCSLARESTSQTGCLPRLLAGMSKKTISSAPIAL